MADARRMLLGALGEPDHPPAKTVLGKRGWRRL